MHYNKSELMTFLCWPSKAGFGTKTNISEISFSYMQLVDTNRYEYVIMHTN